MLRTLQRQSGTYLLVLRWFGRDFLLRYRGRTTGILASRFAGLASQLGAFGVLAYYVRLLESDAAVSLLGVDMPARQSLTLLALVGAVALAALCAASVLTYLANRWTVHLSGRYEQACSRRSLQLARDGRLGDADVALAMTRDHPHIMARAARTLLGSLLPSMMLVIIVIPILLMLHPLLTVIVLMMMCASLAVHYRLSVAASRSSQELSRTGRDALAAYREAISRAHDGDDAAPDAVAESSAIVRNAQAYTNRLLATDNSRFASDLFGAAILIIVLISLGGSILATGGGWGTLLVYLLALRYCMGQMKQSLAAVAAMSRFVHQVRAYIGIIQQPGDDAAGREQVQVMVSAETSL